MARLVAVTRDVARLPAGRLLRRACETDRAAAGAGHPDVSFSFFLNVYFFFGWPEKEIYSDIGQPDQAEKEIYIGICQLAQPKKKMKWDRPAGPAKKKR